MAPPSTRTALVVAGWLGCAGVQLTLWAAVPDRVDGDNLLVTLVALAPTVLLGTVLALRRPDSPVGPALTGLAALPALTFALEATGAAVGGDLGAALAAGAWVHLVTGFGLLCQAFPDGLLPRRRWRLLPGVFLGVAVALQVLLGLTAAGVLELTAPQLLPGYAALLVALAASVAPLVLRFRRGPARVRRQVGWLALGAVCVPVLLATGWGLQLVGVPVGLAYLPVLAALLLAVPASVAVAVLRHDLLDVDRLLGQTAAWLATAVTAAAVFAAGVWATVRLVPGQDTATGAAVGAFLAAIGLLPLHRRALAVAGRVLDPERTVLHARLRTWVHDVRDGRADAAGVTAMLRALLDDPDLDLLLRSPDGEGWVSPAGEPVPGPADDDPGLIPLRSAGVAIGVLRLGRTGTRRLRRAREAVVELQLPLELARLQVGLRTALTAVQDSRARLVGAAAAERVRLERDLHDGAQTDLLAIGMALRRLARDGDLPPGGTAELDGAVRGIEQVVAELRRLAHGVRPARLDDGLVAAVLDLAAAGPLPVEVVAEGVDEAGPVSEARTTTAYFVVAEALANTYKHAGAARAAVRLEQVDGRLRVQVRDDGVGGAGSATVLRTVRDRVLAVGGRLAVDSPAGAGTTVIAEL
ncbi:histidine kinase [Klenkia sp. PcliD-1-E]|uniref:sensor histidine kinase n=1 Tax=Klenkia sp. PcliD-1-E TaxID=2954492 RepID=UPI00209858AA|nr:histidine kinase [Klenkia sp. PcliD-1-E]MCO7220789.1 histidine kinase [Klenkia sp. PcliD-1-E]